jgi:hypothetical protein
MLVFLTSQWHVAQFMIAHRAPLAVLKSVLA